MKSEIPQDEWTKCGNYSHVVTLFETVRHEPTSARRCCHKGDPEQNAKAKGGEFQLNRSNSKHIDAQGVASADAALRYRMPAEPSLDQNTVDLQIEQSNYAENSVQFQASFTLLNSKFKGLIGALRGE